MRQVMIQYQDGIPVTVNTYIAEYGFKKKGYQIERFTLDDVKSWEQAKEKDPNDLMFGFMSRYIFVGGTQTLLRILDLIDVKKPLTYNPQIYLPEYCKRHIIEMTLGEARKAISAERKFFIKPAEDTKLFSGYVARSEVDFISLQQLPADTKVMISNIIDIKSEYRCFVNRKQLVGICHYDGDFTVFPQIDVVLRAIRSFKDQPISYTLDFAILNDGRMELIEVNDGYSLGYCGIHPSIYCQLLEDRWVEITNNKK